MLNQLFENNIPFCEDLNIIANILLEMVRLMGPQFRTYDKKTISSENECHDNE